MWTRPRFIPGVAAVVAILASTSAAAQHTLERTRTVDPSGNADFTTIQGAIADIDEDEDVRWTVLVYAGTYTEAVVLDDVRENINIIGVDGEAVIIDPPADTDAITIKGSGARNNTIQNVTIITDDDTAGEGRGIVIDHEGLGGDPSDITIIGVTITTNGDNSDGILLANEATNLTFRDIDITCNGTASRGIALAETASDVLIDNGSITTMDGHGVEIIKGTMDTQDNVVLRGLTIRADGTARNAVDAEDSQNVRIANCDMANDDAACVVTGESMTIEASVVASGSTAAGVQDPGTTGLRITGCSISAGAQAVFLTESADYLIRDSELSAGDLTLETSETTGPGRIVNCTIIAEQTDNSKVVRALRHDNSSHRLTLEYCTLSAKNTGTGGTRTMFKDNAPVRAIGCVWIAESLTGSADCVGGGGALVHPFEFIDCEFTSSSGERESDVYDIENAANEEPVHVFNSTFSKWTGPVFSFSGPTMRAQRVLTVDAADDDAVLAETTLTGSEQEITTGMTDPDVYRAVTAKGNMAGMDQDVIVIGTNWGGAMITEVITLDGTTIVTGSKPFATVTKLILPASKQAGDGVRVGTSDKLGLHAPLSAASDVIQWAKDVSSVWTIQSSTLTIDVDFATINPGTITTGDSFEFTYLTAR